MRPGCGACAVLLGVLRWGVLDVWVGGGEGWDVLPCPEVWRVQDGAVCVSDYVCAELGTLQERVLFGNACWRWLPLVV